MFENLTDKLQRAFKNLRGQGTLTEENIGEALKEIRMALLEADVNFKVVKELVDHIRDKALGQEVMTSLSPAEQVVKIVRDELINILGKDTARMKFASQPPTVVLMAGLQGSGKTTTSGKLAHWLKQGGHRPMLVSVDVYRPAAREQLRVVAQAINAQLYQGEVSEANTATVERLVKEARREAINNACDVLIVDTAGRLHIDEQLMEEMQSLKKLLNPQEILFVADSMTGQDAVRSADVVMMLAPDEIHSALYREIEPNLRHGAALGFSHGLSVRFGLVAPRSDLDVFLVAPKGPGTALRSLYQGGKGMIALWAVEQDSTGSARVLALAYGRAIGCARAGLIGSTFAEEAEADLFNEQAVVWGGVPELLIAGFETLVEGGIAPEVALLECVGELKLIADLIDERGIAGMREVISNTAELGALLGGRRIVDSSVRERMRQVLAEVRAGRFAGELSQEEAGGYARLERSRAEARGTLLEATFRKLSETER